MTTVPDVAAPAPDGVLDSHVHLWDPERQRHRWLDDAALAPLRRRFDLTDHRHAAANGMAGLPVDGVVLVQALDATTESRDLLDTGAADDTVVGVVGWVDLTAPDAGDRIERLRTAPGGEKLCGIRHLVHDEPDAHWLARPWVRRGLAAVADAGLTFDLLIRPHQLAVATDTVDRLPGLTFVLDHAGKPDLGTGSAVPAEWATGMRHLAERPNVAVKLSGMTTLTGVPVWTPADLEPAVELLLTTFGPERILFGSDWPVCLLTSSWDRWASAVTALLAPLTGDERRDILRGTAERVYRLSSHSPLNTTPTKESPC